MKKETYLVATERLLREAETSEIPGFGTQRKSERAPYNALKYPRIIFPSGRVYEFHSHSFHQKDGLSEHLDFRSLSLLEVAKHTGELPKDYEACGTCGHDHLYDGSSLAGAKAIETAHKGKDNV